MYRRVGLALLLVGCAHSGRGDGYAGWHTVTTAHVAVHTPLSAGDAEETALQLELLYEALERALFPRSDLPRVEVLLFERPGDAPRQAADAREGGGGGREKGALVLSVRDNRRERAGGTGFHKFTTSWQMAAARELAHRFLDRALVHTPQWLEVGLTRYLATAQIEADTAIFGRRPDDLAVELGKGRAIPLGAVLDGGRGEFHGAWGRDYDASAWGFVHYLLDGEGGKLRPRFDAMMAALLAGGGRTDSRTAVTQAFPDVPFPALEARVRDYQVEMLGRRGSFHPYAVNLTPPPATRGTATPSDPLRVQALLLGVRPR
jgi:hypothetical protein